MLYWGIFTSGFIIGAIFALFVMLNKKENGKSKSVSYPTFLIQNDDNNPDKIFEQITKVNYVRD